MDVIEKWFIQSVWFLPSCATVIIIVVLRVLWPHGTIVEWTKIATWGSKDRGGRGLFLFRTSFNIKSQWSRFPFWSWKAYWKNQLFGSVVADPLKLRHCLADARSRWQGFCVSVITMATVDRRRHCLFFSGKMSIKMCNWAFLHPIFSRDASVCTPVGMLLDEAVVFIAGADLCMCTGA